MSSTSDLQPDSGAPAARRADRPCAPATLGHWRLLRPLGRGQQGSVYLAAPAGTPQESAACYALKLLDERWNDDPRIVTLLLREAAVGRALSHPHLVSILAEHVTEPPYYLVMPRLPGMTLAELLASGHRPAVPETLWIARQVAEALAALDAAGWMHADVKPANIFISPEGHVTLIDLGFARRPEDEGSAVDRPLLGTVHYLAPELITSALGADIRSDLYSLGATLFEMLTGRLPFSSNNLADLAIQHRQGIADDVGQIAPHLPPGVVRLVREMLAKQPIRRPQTPHELIERLVQLEIETFAQRAAA